MLRKSSLQSGSSASRETPKRLSHIIGIGSGLSTSLMEESTTNSVLSTLRLDVSTTTAASMGRVASEEESTSPHTLPFDPTIAANLSAMIDAICNTQLALSLP
ncbi:Hypothetical protein, putative [Bodo saltans]|uniref:Uncharacterized protein n=1 Tax=Bodo saltans TaxID=75058 RepID=A0A0S4JB53_BODSA|nr:Hypothetical protein, putative [Bodo saltans]|eukprot:CUG87396.1 Hypothetical protein, putative [Bodo saltans]